ncbi:MAG: DinB family protein [Chloroflexi bacterium]|nr:DinB family protein [Chloroflexota bacterium]
MLPEAEGYVVALQEARAELLQMLDGLNPQAFNWCPLADDTNSLFALATHCLGAERAWLHELVGGRKIERDRAAEFRAHGEDATPLRAAYAAAASVTHEVFAGLTEADLSAIRERGGEQHSVRGCILHILAHYNEHMGQMRLTRQLWENRQARPHEI